MKKNSLLLIVAVLFSVYSSAQQLNITRKSGGHIINDSTIIKNGPATSIITDSLYVINTSGSSVNVNVRRDSISEIVGSDNYFCWYLNCFGPATDSSYPSEVSCPIPAGDTNKSFYCDYNAGGNIGTSWVRYVFINAANRSDTSWVIIEYNATATGVKNIGDVRFSAPYPNPASSSVNFSYNIGGNIQSANLKIFNMLGECVQTLPLSPEKNKTTLDVQSVPSGIYVCEIEADGCQPVYQKLIVSH